VSAEESKSIFEPEKPEVPSDWSVASFKDVVEVISDKGKRTKQRDYLEEGAVPVIDQGQDFIGGYIDDESMAFEGDLPIVVFGDHTRAVKFVNQRFAVGADGVKLLRPRECFDPKYFYYLLKSLNVPSRGYSRHFQFLKKFYLPIAPPEQQIRIVEEIEKQFSRLDEAVANLKRVKANLKRYKAAVLKAAVQGKLTEEWRKQHPDVEPADKLLERILEERRVNWQGRGKYKEPVELDTAGLPELPAGWCCASADQLTSLITDGEHITPKRSEEGVLLLSARNVLNGKLSLDKVDYVPVDEYERLTKRLKVEAGDVLLSCSGTVGRSCLAPNDLAFALVRSVAVLRTIEVLPEFFCLQIQSSFIQMQIEEKKTQTAQANIFQGKIRTLSFLLPPIPEQQEIVSQVDRYLTNINVTESQVDIDLRRADSLRQSLLKKAFSGKLLGNK
jgi:type I restriction enzyme S subunit